MAANTVSVSLISGCMSKAVGVEPGEAVVKRQVLIKKGVTSQLVWFVCHAGESANCQAG